MNLISQTAGKDWNDLETSMGQLDYSPMMDSYSLSEEDESTYHEVSLNEDNARALAEAVIRIPEYFLNWVETVRIEKVRPLKNFQKLIRAAEFMFLNFNYTPTVQTLYGVKEICHIHGRQGEKLDFGHGSDKDHYEYYMSHYVGSEENLCSIDRRLRKNTIEAIRRHKDFFDQLSNSFDAIYSFGFSFSEVDRIYIREICTSMQTQNVTWFLNDYDSEETRKQFEQIIRSCGFEGKFSIYHI